jgi:hypothetical protein
MDFKTFHESLSSEAVPRGLSPALAGFWWDAKGDWTRAHESAQQDEGTDGAWVHAYLHRKEGDSSNASYWYARAGKVPAKGSFEDEWNRIAAVLTGSASASG